MGWFFDSEYLLPHLTKDCLNQSFLWWMTNGAFLTWSFLLHLLVGIPELHPQLPTHKGRSSIQIWAPDGGVGDELREKHWHIYTIMCKIDSQWEAAYSTGSSAQCSVTTSTGGMQVGGRRLRGRGYMYTYSWLLDSRHQHNIVKQLSSDLK